MAHEDRDPGLPLKLTPVSNGEFDPQPMTPLTREVLRRAHAAVDDNARRTGVSRRRFLYSAAGTATALGVLAACSNDKNVATGDTTGGTFDVSTDSTLDPDAAADLLDDDVFIMDVQNHCLEVPPGAEPLANFPQSGCGDGNACYDIEHYLDLMFLESQTSVAVLSAIPFGGVQLSPEVMREAGRIAERLCGEERVLMQAETSPSFGDLEEELANMDRLEAEFPIKAWKCYTHWGGPGWYFDDHDPDAPQVGQAFLAHADASSVDVVAVHKGFSGTNEFGSPVDIGPAANLFPDLNFVIYHSGFEVGDPETAYDPDKPAAELQSVDRLIRTLADNDVAPGSNVYAEIGSTWKVLLNVPDQAAHTLGKLLLHVGEDNICWGTDSIWYGTPQDQIDAFRTFQITEAFQEEFGYPALTDEIKAKIFGLNSARLYGIEPTSGACPFTRDELAGEYEARQISFDTFGPTTARAARQMQATPPPWAWQHI